MFTTLIPIIKIHSSSTVSLMAVAASVGSLEHSWFNNAQLEIYFVI